MLLCSQLKHAHKIMQLFFIWSMLEVEADVQLDGQHWLVKIYNVICKTQIIYNNKVLYI